MPVAGPAGQGKRASIDHRHMIRKERDEKCQ
jgi:hypothetical protein